MRELIHLVNKSVNEGLLPKIISDFELSKGIYVKYENIDDIKDDNILIIDNKEDLVKNELYDWFRYRNFYDGLLFNSANKCLETKKRILSVNAHGFIVKYSSILKNDEVPFEESVYNHFKKLKEINDDLNIDVEVESETYFNLIRKIYEKYKDIIDKNIDIKLVFYKANATEDNFKDSYMKYLDKYLFSNTIKVNEETLGANPFQNTYNTKKPTLCPVNGIRELPFVVTKEEALGTVYLSKMSYKQLNLLINTSLDLDYDISWGDKGKLNSFNQILTTKDKIKFEEYNFLNNFECTKELKIYSQRSIINKLDKKNLFNGVIEDILFKPINSSKDISNIAKKHSKNITDISVIQKILSNKDLLKRYSLNTKIDITNVLESICKDIYVYRLRQCEELGDLNNLSYTLTDIINILANIHKKGDFNNMPSKINELLNKFNSQITNESIEIETLEEFYFLAGQAIRYLIGQKESSNQKSNILGNALVRNSSSIKDELVKAYQRYSHALSAYSLAPINLVYQGLLLFEEEKSKKNIDNKLWYYYQAGLVGKNLFYVKRKDMEGNNNENE